MRKSFILAATALTLLSTGITSVAVNSTTIILASSKKYKSINKDLAKNLKEDKSYADQDPDNYGYSKYIEKVKYTGNSDINVYVNGGFKELSESEKTEVLNQVQSLAKMVLVQNSKISSSEAGEGLILEAFNDKNSVAVSKISNHKAYRFTNN